MPLTADNVYGILSMFFWTLTVIVSIKYVVLVLRADNNGEGGLIAMLALASHGGAGQARRCAGGCWWSASSAPRSSIGDGVITPAISVLVGGRGPGGGVAGAARTTSSR